MVEEAGGKWNILEKFSVYSKVPISSPHWRTYLKLRENGNSRGILKELDNFLWS